DYLEAGHGRAHEALLCIQTGSTLLDPKRWRFSTEEFYVKSADEMARVFAEIPDACRNTLAVAERCNLTLEFGSFHLPRYVVPENHTLESYLEHVARDGLKRRYGANPALPSRSASLTSFASSRRWGSPATSWSCGTSFTTRASEASPWARAAAPRPALWSRIAWASRTSTRSGMACCSSASSTRSGCRCPTWTSPSPTIAATRSSGTSPRSTATTGSLTSSRSGRWAPRPPFATSAACWA